MDFILLKKESGIIVMRLSFVKLLRIEFFFLIDLNEREEKEIRVQNHISKVSFLLKRFLCEITRIKIHFLTVHVQGIL